MDTYQGHHLDYGIPAASGEPDAATLLVGSLLWSRSDDAAPVLEAIDTGDLEDPPLRTITATIRDLVEVLQPHDPIAVGDELQRRGLLAGETGRIVVRRLTDAITAGSASNHLAPIVYARSVVADAYRRRIELAGKAFVEAAAAMAEDDLAQMVRGQARGIEDHAARLAALRKQF